MISMAYYVVRIVSRIFFLMPFVRANRQKKIYKKLFEIQNKTVQFTYSLLKDFLYRKDFYCGKCRVPNSSYYSKVQYSLL